MKSCKELGCCSTGCLAHKRLLCTADTSLLLCLLLCLCCSYLILLSFDTDQWATYLYRQDFSCNRQRLFGVCSGRLGLLVPVWLPKCGHCMALPLPSNFGAGWFP